MASYPAAGVAPVTPEHGVVAAPARPSAARRWLAPPFTALLFLVPLVVAVCRPTSSLQDPGTGWHLASGHYLLTTGSLPTHDLFSFTATRHEWINYYWLFEVTGAMLERLGGLPLYAMACLLIYAFVPVLLFRRMLRIGAGMLPALLLTLVAFFILCSHALARPHVVTYVFFALVLERLDDYGSGRVPASALWWLPLLTALWCNIHGGFVAALAMTGIFAGVAAVRAVMFRDRAERRRAIVFAAVLGAMVLATLLNPRGIRLHTSILAHLNQESARYFVEFASPDFQTRSGPFVFFEALALSPIVLLAVARKRLAWIECALLVFFLHEALHSVRHMNLFAIVAAPIVARELTPTLARRWPRFHARTAQIAIEQAALRSPFLYFPAICAVGMVLAVSGVLRLPASLDDMQLTRGAAEFVAQHRPQFARPFNTDNLGGSLIYRFWPELRVFVDDRIFVYGDTFVGRRYFEVLYARKGWRKVLEKYRISSAIVTASAPCATLFREAADWELAFDDGKNAIFFRRPDAATQASTRQ